MFEQAEVQFGREICGELKIAESREWLVTNGIGGYASGTIAGSATRRYHGLLIAALQPPVGRTQLVSAIDEIVHYAGADFSLATHRWASGAVEPKGFLLLEDCFWKSASGCGREKTPLMFSTRSFEETARLKWN